MTLPKKVENFYIQLKKKGNSLLNYERQNEMEKPVGGGLV